MLNFITKIIENPWEFSEEEKYDMLLGVTNKDVIPSELAEIINYIKSKQLINIELNDAIDICGTWWSKLPRINTSTIACIKLAKQWIKVTKQWNNASSGRFWSFDLIERFWYNIPRTENEIIDEYRNNNIAFLHAKVLYPFFKEFLEVRKKYNKPTIFNIIWPLLNPWNSDYQIIWCSFEDKMELMINTCKILWRKNILLVRWEDWLDEVTLSAKTKVFELRDWIIKEYYIWPEDYWFKTTGLSDIMANSIDDKISIARKIISWERVWEYSNLIDLNISVALKFLNKEL